jgi:hypothetical protein
MITLPTGDVVKLNNNDKLFYGTSSFMTFQKNLMEGVNSPVAPHGTTAQRPTRYIKVGTLFIDDTLDKLIRVSSLNPTVLKDSMGLVV